MIRKGSRTERKMEERRSEGVWSGLSSGDGGRVGPCGEPGETPQALRQARHERATARLGGRKHLQTKKGHEHAKHKAGREEGGGWGWGLGGEVRAAEVSG